MLSNFSDTQILAILVSSYKITKIGYINLVSHGQTAFLLFIMGGGKRVWTGSQTALVLALPNGMSSVNKRNVTRMYLVAVNAYYYKRIIYLQLYVLWMGEWM